MKNNIHTQANSKTIEDCNTKSNMFLKLKTRKMRRLEYSNSFFNDTANLESSRFVKKKIKTESVPELFGNRKDLSPDSHRLLCYLIIYIRWK